MSILIRNPSLQIRQV